MWGLFGETGQTVRRDFALTDPPAYFVDGDMFYSQDRLELVERALTRPFA